MPKKKVKKTKRVSRIKKKTRFSLNGYLLILLAVLLLFFIVVSLTSKKPLVFKGTIPCADCPGIEETITLNPDNTYLYKDVYLERDVTYVDEGKWTIIKIQGKNEVIYELSSKNGERKIYYALEGIKLSSLDSNLEPLPSPYNAPLVKQ